MWWEYHMELSFKISWFHVISQQINTHYGGPWWSWNTVKYVGWQGGCRILSCNASQLSQQAEMLEMLRLHLLGFTELGLLASLLQQGASITGREIDELLIAGYSCLEDVSIFLQKHIEHVIDPNWRIIIFFFRIDSRHTTNQRGLQPELQWSATGSQLTENQWTSGLTLRCHQTWPGNPLDSLGFQ